MGDHLGSHVIEPILDGDGMINSIILGDLILVNKAVLVQHSVFLSVSYMEYLLDVQALK